ncbi:ATP-binding protein [Uliginosibacterium sp. H3]|uniref:ATP-binding protein n=1 Tax=Uliginosibacterium silvisoli TaxID=3114758 RepID=A0ABU6K088_9RHOO|nr:ATP-binding protein [Uliginosibacterium sp. H3]
MLHGLALAALHATDTLAERSAEAAWLDAQCRLCDSVAAPLQAWLASPPQEDRLLHAIASALHLQPVELIAVALAAAVETDAMAGRVIAWLQAPVGTSRPTVGLALAAANALGMDAALNALLEGGARDTGLLMLDSDLETSRRPLPEQALHVPLPLVMALRDGFSRWPGVKLEQADPTAAVASLRAATARQAHALKSGGKSGGNNSALVIRSGHPREARTAATLIAHALDMQVALFESEPPKGVGVWLALLGALPVLCHELAPGDSRKLSRLPGYTGPVLVACGPDGSFEHEGDTVASWRVPLPDAAERSGLWAGHTPDAHLAEQLGLQYRYDAARIRQLGRAASYQAGLDNAQHIARAHISAAARSGVAAELGTLAELLPENIGDDALVIPPTLREGLVGLRQRCELRENLAAGLGPSARTRYKPGVRALLVGASGTGKTLAAGWLATQLGLPLYRVDAASVTSKYIGETEKNLAQLFARAEHAEVVLLFDEADSLFGKRTDVKESNDKFANAQTNYLLQRIESFEGIAILTSNSRSRFDSAFTRRLDVILDFPQPSPDERRALWVAHLGDAHALSGGDLNRVASACDLAGGHIRNVVLAAAARARHQQRDIAYADVLVGIAAECRKLGRQVPAGLGSAADAESRAGA